ncbi:MAG: ATP-binding protein [Defluviitaleaceae bacterium]|nr:ATP-binding protein [Defluviitaleaceae bacterium]
MKTKRMAQINAGIFALVFAIILFLVWITVNDVASRASYRLAQAHARETMGNFMAQIGGDLALLQYVASSDAVREWFADEADEGKRRDAFDELLRIADRFQSTDFYIGIAASLNEYTFDLTTTIDGFVPYEQMSRDDPRDAWFFTLLEAENEYLFNIDIDKIEERWRIWINHEVVRNGETVGVLCASFRLDDILIGMFGDHGNDDRLAYIVDRYGYIHIGSTELVLFFELDEENVRVTDRNAELGAAVADFVAENGPLFDGNMLAIVPLRTGDYSIAAISAIPSSDWMLVTMYTSSAIFSTWDMVPIIVVFAIISVIIMYMFIKLSAFQARGYQQQALEKSKMLLETSPMLIEIWDEKLNFMECNTQLLKMFGLSSKEEYIERYVEFIPEFQPCGTDSQIKGLENTKKALEDGFIRYEWMRRLPNGEELPVEVTSFYIERDGVKQLVAYNHDLRPIKAAMKRERELEEQLEKQELDERIRLAFDAAPMCISWYSAEGKLLRCNNEALNMFGYSTEEALIDTVNERFWNFFPHYQPCGTPTIEMMNEMFKTAEVKGRITFDFTHLTISGQDLPTEVTLVRVDHFDTYIFIAYIRDLRQIRQLEQERIEALEESNRAKSRFLARMSHEIRTPLTAVMGISEVRLRKNDMSPDVKDGLMKIYSSSKTLLSIVNDILDFSKIESGKMPIVNQKYDVASLVADAAQLHLVYLHDKPVSFDMRVDENLPLYLVGDVLRIRQIINNLLTNAFKYTETGTVTLSIYAGNPVGRHVTINITIKDTGAGMTKEQIESLMHENEYTRLHEQEKPFVSGTGLGIPIVLSLADMMGAKLDIKSKPGEGTEITVAIKQEIVGTDILGPKLAADLQNFELKTCECELTFVPDEIPHGRVLVVDDVDTNLYVAEAMLESFGLDVEVCERAQDAIDKIRNGNTYDIVFMDHMMPDMDGIAAVKILREINYTRPIIAFTANAVKGQDEMFMQNGFDGFMSKPIDIKVLNACLVRFVRG